MALIGCHTDREEIKRVILEETGKELTSTNLKYYATADAWKLQREKVREKFENELMEEPLASKRNRVKELTKAYYRLEPSDDTLMDATNVLAKIREEVEGKSSNFVFNAQYNQYNGLSDEDLRKVIDENTRFLQIANNIFPNIGI